MTTLDDIQKSIAKQLVQDYGGAQYELLRDLITLGLAEEAGEVAALRKRELRHNFRDIKTLSGIRTKYVEELGDVLWYLTACCIMQNTSLEEIWATNQDKLEARYGGVKEAKNE